MIDRRVDTRRGLPVASNRFVLPSYSQLVGSDWRVQPHEPYGTQLAVASSALDLIGFTVNIGVGGGFSSATGYGSISASS